ncbi:VanZ family protein [Psychroflexus salinarum]|uniref:VanZ family protein n=1 Tax=Psychroflexus salinarum TaxID=546024 RepID=A0ABW3GU23_9FLAO
MHRLINLILNRKVVLPLAIICTLSIGYLSLSDISTFPKIEVKHEDKIYHFVSYFVLNTIWLFAIVHISSKSLLPNILISLGILSFGIVIEIFQEIMTDYRVFDFYDILANSVGVLVSYLCFELFRKRIFENINSN